MVIKYRCWDKTLQQWRTPHPEHMVSIFVPGTRNAMRIVANEQYDFYLWTGFEDMNGTDVYPGDIMDHTYYVNWDILNGCWVVCDRKTQKAKYTFAEFKPHEHLITGSVLEEQTGEHIS